MKTLFKERSHARLDALRRGEPTVAVYERFGRARMAVQAAVPRNEPWDGKPLSRPERKWQPPRSSPLKKELRMEGEEEAKDAMKAEPLARSKAAVESTAAVSEPDQEEELMQVDGPLQVSVASPAPRD